MAGRKEGSEKHSTGLKSCTLIYSAIHEIQCKTLQWWRAMCWEQIAGPRGCSALKCRKLIRTACKLHGKFQTRRKKSHIYETLNFLIDVDSSIYTKSIFFIISFCFTIFLICIFLWGGAKFPVLSYWITEFQTFQVSKWERGREGVNERPGN